MEKTTNIYCLICPISGHIRYVGKANNLKQRLQNHLNPARFRNTHKFNWIKSLRKKGVKPLLKVLEDNVPMNNWKAREQYWIRYFLKRGYNLTNYCVGGEGLTYGNQTSFKKGHKSWNEGLGTKGIYAEQVCEICKNIFRSTITKKTCSKSCLSKYKKANLNSTGVFQKDHVPWNKGLSGYKTNSKIVLQYSIDGVFIQEHLGCKEAGIAMNCTGSNIRNVCLGHAKTAKGFIWKYKI